MGVEKEEEQSEQSVEHESSCAEYASFCEREGIDQSSPEAELQAPFCQFADATTPEHFEAARPVAQRGFDIPFNEEECGRDSIESSANQRIEKSYRSRVSEVSP